MDANPLIGSIDFALKRRGLFSTIIGAIVLIAGFLAIWDLAPILSGVLPEPFFYYIVFLLPVVAAGGAQEFAELAREIRNFDDCADFIVEFENIYEICDQVTFEIVDSDGTHEAIATEEMIEEAYAYLDSRQPDCLVRLVPYQQFLLNLVASFFGLLVCLIPYYRFGLTSLAMIWAWLGMIVCVFVRTKTLEFFATHGEEAGDDD